jgi:hypothetical protein
MPISPTFKGTAVTGKATPDAQKQLGGTRPPNFEAEFFDCELMN